MQPIGPLMWEHRLIEQMVPLIRQEIGRIEADHRADPVFIERAVDFFRTYADRTHHGKEEDILFEKLAGRDLTPELKAIMKELVAEHLQARKTVRSLLEITTAYRNGDTDLVTAIVRRLKDLAELYPAHIEKEDRRFFFPVMDYFTKEEQDSMLREFHEFDRRMIHEKYQGIMEDLGGRVVRWK